MQILQQSISFTVRVISCMLRRTQKSQYCGNYDQGFSQDSDGVTYNTQNLRQKNVNNFTRTRKFMYEELERHIIKTEELNYISGKRMYINITKEEEHTRIQMQWAHKFRVKDKKNDWG